MGSDADITEVGKAGNAPTQATLGSRVKAHYKKWWWVHVLAAIIIILVIILPIIYVGYPNIAQSSVNKADMNVKKMSISDPDTDSFQMDMTDELKSSGSESATIYPFDATVSMHGGSPFSTVNVPQMKAANGAETHINQRVELSDKSAFSDFTKAAVKNEEVKMNIYGKPSLKVGALPKVSVDFNKTITVKGMNEMKGSNVTNYDFKLTSDSNGNNMNGTVYIPNPSVMSIDMGNLTLDLSVSGTSIGSCYLNNLSIKPGDNYTPMSAAIDDMAVAKMLLKYPDGILPIDATGKSVTYNGKNLTYFTDALSATTIRLNVDIYQGLNQLLKTSLRDGLGDLIGGSS